MQIDPNALSNPVLGSQSVTRPPLSDMAARAISPPPSARRLVGDGRVFSRIEGGALASLSQKSLPELRQARAEIATSSSSFILGAMKLEGRKEAQDKLRTIDHLIKVREVGKVCESGAAVRPEELSEALRGLVALQARKQIKEGSELFSLNDEILRYLGSHPEDRVVAFEGVFGLGTVYTAEESEILEGWVAEGPFKDVLGNVDLMRSRGEPALQALFRLHLLTLVRLKEKGSSSHNLYERSESFFDSLTEKAMTQLKGEPRPSERAKIYEYLALVAKYGGDLKKISIQTAKEEDPRVEKARLHLQSVLREGGVLSHTEGVVVLRQKLKDDIGVIGRILKALGLLQEVSTRRATEALIRILDALDEAIRTAKDEKYFGESGSKAVWNEMRRLDEDQAFEDILRANPVLSDRYLQQKQAIKFPTPQPKKPEAFEARIGKLGKFLRLIGVLKHLAPERAQQACAILMSDLEAVELPDAESENEGGPLAKRAEIERFVSAVDGARKDPHLSQIIHTNSTLRLQMESLERRASALHERLEVHDLSEKMANAASLSSKAEAVARLMKFSPSGRKAKELRSAAFGEGGFETLRKEIFKDDPLLDTEKQFQRYIDLTEIEKLPKDLKEILFDKSYPWKRFEELKRTVADRVSSLVVTLVQKIPSYQEPAIDFARFKESSAKRFGDEYRLHQGPALEAAARIIRDPECRHYLKQQKADIAGLTSTIANAAVQVNIYDDLRILKENVTRLQNSTTLDGWAQELVTLHKCELRTEAVKSFKEGLLSMRVGYLREFIENHPKASTKDINNAIARLWNDDQVFFAVMKKDIFQYLDKRLEEQVNESLLQKPLPSLEEAVELIREIEARLDKKKCEELKVKLFSAAATRTEELFDLEKDPQKKNGLCLNLMRAKSSLNLHSHPDSTAVIDKLMTGIAQSVSSLTEADKATFPSLLTALRGLQPENASGGIICLTIDQNKKIEIAKRRLEILAADTSAVPIDKAQELAFACSFLEKNGAAAGLETKIEAIKKSLREKIPSVGGSDGEAIRRVLTWDKAATSSDVATLIKHRKKLQFLRNEAVLEFINAVQLPDPLPMEEFIEMEKFFEEMNEPTFVAEEVPRGGGGPTTLRLRQQVAEEVVWQHRPKSPPNEEIGQWYQNQVQMKAADQAFVEEVEWTAPTAQYSTEELCSIPKIEVPFAGIDSTNLVDATEDVLPTKVVASRIVSPKMVEHLLRDRVDIAIGEKSAPASGDGRVPEWPITNMESIAALYFTEFAAGEAGASIFYKADVVEYPKKKVQKVLVARNLHPDTEVVRNQTCREGDVPVFLMLAALGDEEVVGDGSEVSVPSAEERARWNETQRQEYDKKLLKNYVFHLYPGGRRPAKSEIKDENVLTLGGANRFMENLIKDQGKTAEDILTAAKDKYVRVDGQLVSLYVYLVTAIHQTRNNHAVAEACGSYTQTLMPPQIFALKEGDSTFHSRLQCLAYKCIGPEKFSQLAVISPNTYQDEGLRSLYEAVFKKDKIIPMGELFGGRRDNGIPEGAIGTLILEANSDSLGDNLSNEKGGGSQEGVIGLYVRTGCRRSNPRATMGVAYT